MKEHYGVINVDGDIEICFTTAIQCHDHINDMLSDYDCPELTGWTVRKVFVEGQESQPADGVSEKWKLAPIEPTTEMIKAAFDCFEVINPMQYGNGTEARNAVYTAMICAAPQPPKREE